MHIPDGLLDPISIIVFWILTIGFMAFGYLRIARIFEKEDSEKLIPYIGVLAAIIFAFQFVNFPVPGGTSGHLVGGTLVAVILGPWSSVMVLFLVLIIQSLFGDGGITAVGANTFNMGIIAGIVGYFIVLGIIRLLNRTSMDDTKKITISTAVGSYFGIVLAALVCGIELGISGVLPYEFAIPAMVYWHLLIGIGEAIISGLIILYVFKTKPSLIITQDSLGVMK